MIFHWQRISETHQCSHDIMSGSVASWQCSVVLVMEAKALWSNSCVVVSVSLIHVFKKNWVTMDLWVWWSLSMIWTLKSPEIAKKEIQGRLSFTYPDDNRRAVVTKNGWSWSSTFSLESSNPKFCTTGKEKVKVKVCNRPWRHWRFNFRFHEVMWCFRRFQLPTSKKLYCGHWSFHNEVEGNTQILNICVVIIPIPSFTGHGDCSRRPWRVL